MSTLRLRPLPSPYARALLTVAVVALALGIVLGRPDAAVLAIPLVWTLALSGHRALPREVTVVARVEPPVCFEGELSVLHVTIDGWPGPCRMDLDLPSGLRMPPDERRTRKWLGLAPRANPRQTYGPRGEWHLRSTRWGRWSAGPLTLRLRSPDRLWQARLNPAPAVLTVYPHAQFAVLARDMAAGTHPRAGEHTTRLPGSGVEFAAIRPWTPGESLRRVNRRASERSGRLQLNAFADERAVDLVVCVDAYQAVGPPGHTTLDVSLRGAAGLAQSYVRAHDRVGAVAFGGALRWLGPDVGDRQFYRLAGLLLDVRRDETFLDPDVGRIPRTALPPRARVVVFSPLLDPRAVAVLRDLRMRGHSVVLVDPLVTRPHGSGQLRPVALRWWRLHRTGLEHEIARLGVPVVHWDGTRPLELPFRYVAVARR
ncbi:DUF58 domain-containing protein [Streptomyces sp. PTM05]|uniref:DUF58 domain-containing protein n=1 Tax=Streptantibioticus parmotrematis TaxID=2873249 RepID=A0ABS7R1C9_9ACTN|nr:DUF58 domain-containing protein [Streptantibioticus parmotrematis]MBY8889270.1 DUF58 domain-containing protein [Streptantibioticus parmotrematis]